MKGLLKERTGKNVGIEKSKQIYESFGIEYAFPECSGSDWNDYYTEQLCILRKEAKMKKFGVAEGELQKTARERIKRSIMKRVKFFS